MSACRLTSDRNQHLCSFLPSARFHDGTASRPEKTNASAEERKKIAGNRLKYEVCPLVGDDRP